VKLTKLSKKQADYLGVPIEVPYKPEHYRYQAWWLRSGERGNVGRVLTNAATGIQKANGASVRFLILNFYSTRRLPGFRWNKAGYSVIA
jgi:hypothetical protein